MSKYILTISLLSFYTHLLNGQSLTIDAKGFGSSCKEAKNDALRNAINTAYGSVIYSKTEISNDNLVSDDITMLTSGNVMNYEVIEDCIERGNLFSTLLKVTVSQTELKKFIEGKGKSISISGELLKQKTDQEINAKNIETSILENLLMQLQDLVKDPFDYEISIGQITIKDGKYCSLPAEITIKTNLNFLNAYIKLAKEIEKLSINKSDCIFRTETLKEINHPITINNKDYFFRSNKSINLLKQFYESILLKMDDYIVVDDCLNELFIKVSSSSVKLDENIFFPDPDFISKIVSGSYTATIEEIGSLNRINIFAASKLNSYKNGRLLSDDLSIMKYSETNPLEFESLKNNLIGKFEDLTKKEDKGIIKFDYSISFSENGKNNSVFNRFYTSHKEYQALIEEVINHTKLNSSKLCGKYNKTTEELKIELKWHTYNSSYSYEMRNESIYNPYFESQKLPFGKYTLTIKEKELNDSKFKDVYISNYKTRGPSSAIYSIFLPGWGTRKVTFNENNGWKRFWIVIVPVAISLTSKFISNNKYNNYLNSTDQVKIDEYYRSANALNKVSIISAGIGASFYIYELSWVLGRGIENNSKRKSIETSIIDSKLQIQNQCVKIK